MSAIYLDTNVLPRSGNVDSLEFSILLAAAREAEHEIVLPALVADEATSHRLRTIEAAFDALRRAHRDARALANVALLPELPVPGELAREFERKLASLCRIVTTPDGAADEALRRETFRLRPAREGRGARDVAIWLTVKSAHEAMASEGYFVSQNVKDFANPSDRSQLHPDLRAEVQGSDLHFATSIEELLEIIAAHDDPLITDAFLRANDDLQRAVGQAIGEMNLNELLRDIPDAPAEGRKRRLYIAGEVVPELIGVNDSKGLRVEGRRIGVAWTRWKIRFPLGVLERQGPGMILTTIDIACLGTFQIWARADDDGGLDAEVSSVGALKPIDELSGG